jgi:hypothetical protein
LFSPVLISSVPTEVGVVLKVTLCWPDAPNVAVPDAVGAPDGVQFVPVFQTPLVEPFQTLCARAGTAASAAATSAVVPINAALTLRLGRAERAKDDRSPAIKFRRSVSSSELPHAVCSRHATLDVKTTTPRSPQTVGKS